MAGGQSEELGKPGSERWLTAGCHLGLVTLRASLGEGTKHPGGELAQEQRELCGGGAGGSQMTDDGKHGLKAKVSALGLCASAGGGGGGWTRWGGAGGAAIKKQLRCTCLSRVLSNFRSFFYITNSNPLSVTSITHISHSKSLVFLFWSGAFMLCKCFPLFRQVY